MIQLTTLVWRFTHRLGTLNHENVGFFRVAGFYEAIDGMTAFYVRSLPVIGVPILLYLIFILRRVDELRRALKHPAPTKLHCPNCQAQVDYPELSQREKEEIGQAGFAPFDPKWLVCKKCQKIIPSLDKAPALASEKTN